MVSLADRSEGSTGVTFLLAFRARASVPVLSSAVGFLMWSLRGPSSVLGIFAAAVAVVSLSIGPAVAAPQTSGDEGPPGDSPQETSLEGEANVETVADSDAETEGSGASSGVSQSGGEEEPELGSLAVEDADESGCGIPVAAYTGTPSGRLSGSNRYATAAAIAKAVKSAPSGEGRALFVASGQTFADGLGLGALAAEFGWPLMLTSKQSISPELREYATRLNPTHIYIAGGPGAVSESVKEQLEALGTEDVVTTRFSGADRYQTSQKIAECFNSGVPVVLTTGAKFPDAVVSGAPAAKLGAPVVLTKPGELESSASEALTELKPSEVFVIGGKWSATVRSQVASLTAGSKTPTVLSGKDRYLTAQVVAKHFFESSSKAVLAAGIDFPDALAGVSVAASLNVPILLTQKTCRPKGIETLMKGVKTPVFLGGTGVLEATGHSKTCVAAPKETTQQKVVSFAKTHDGKGYTSGGTGPNSFDCSGFTQYVYKQAGVGIPRTTWQQWTQGKNVSSSPVPGDIAVMEGGGHVAIYLGGNMIIDAGNTRVGVSIRKMWQTPVGYVRFG